MSCGNIINHMNIKPVIVKTVPKPKQYIETIIVKPKQVSLKMKLFIFFGPTICVILLIIAQILNKTRATNLIKHSDLL